MCDRVFGFFLTLAPIVPESNTTSALDIPLITEEGERERGGKGEGDKLAISQANWG